MKAYVRSEAILVPWHGYQFYIVRVLAYDLYHVVMLATRNGGMAFLMLFYLVVRFDGLLMSFTLLLISVFCIVPFAIL